jgi:hypothetical protein
MQQPAQTFGSGKVNARQHVRRCTVQTGVARARRELDQVGDAQAA